MGKLLKSKPHKPSKFTYWTHVCRSMFIQIDEEKKKRNFVEFYYNISLFEIIFCGAVSLSLSHEEYRFKMKICSRNRFIAFRYTQHPLYDINSKTANPHISLKTQWCALSIHVLHSKAYVRLIMCIFRYAN